MKRVINTFRNYEAIFEGASSAFNDTKEKLKYQYGSSREFETRFSEAKRVFDENIATAKQKALQEIEDIFSDLNEKTKEFVQQPAPADLVQTFEAIKALGKDITQGEADMYFDMYRNNYLAARSISNYLYDLKGYLMPIPTVDVIQNELETHHKEAVDFIRNYTGKSFCSALFTTDNNNPWEGYSRKFEAFLNGDVEAFAEVPEYSNELAEALDKIKISGR